MSGTKNKEQIIVRRHDVVRMDAKDRLHIPTGPNPVVVQTDYGPIRVFINQRGSVVVSPLRDVLVHEGYSWSVVMEVTYYGSTYLGPLEVVKFPENPKVALPVSKDNIIRQLRKAASTFMLRQEFEILAIALKDIAERVREDRELLAKAKADLAALPSEADFPLARRFDQWFGTFWVSPAEGELSVWGGGLSGSITVSGKICRLNAALPLERGREPSVSLLNILGGEKQEEVPPALRSCLLELAELVRQNHHDLVSAANAIKSRRRLQVTIATYESRLQKLERFAMMYRHRLDPDLDQTVQPRPSSAA